MQIPAKIQFFGFLNILSHKGRHFSVSKRFWHDFIKSMYGKVEQNKRMGQICQKNVKIRILEFSLQNGFKLMEN